jgi:hypothetical protein
MAIGGRAKKLVWGRAVLPYEVWNVRSQVQRSDQAEIVEDMSEKNDAEELKAGAVLDKVVQVHKAR